MSETRMLSGLLKQQTSFLNEMDAAMLADHLSGACFHVVTATLIKVKCQAPKGFLYISISYKLYKQLSL